MSPTNLHTFDYFWPETTAVIPTSCPSQLREMFNRLPCFERTKSPQQKTFCLGKDFNQQLISVDPIKSTIWIYLGVHWSSMFIVIVVVVMVGPLEKMFKMESKTKDEQWAGHKFSTSAKKKSNKIVNRINKCMSQKDHQVAIHLLCLSCHRSIHDLLVPAIVPMISKSWVFRAGIDVGNLAPQGSIKSAEEVVPERCHLVRLMSSSAQSPFEKTWWQDVKARIGNRALNLCSHVSDHEGPISSPWFVHTQRQNVSHPGCNKRWIRPWDR